MGMTLCSISKVISQSLHFQYVAPQIMKLLILNLDNTARSEDYKTTTKVLEYPNERQATKPQRST